MNDLDDGSIDRRIAALIERLSAAERIGELVGELGRRLAEVERQVAVVEADVIGGREALRELGEVQRANVEGMGNYQRVATARIEQLEERLASVWVPHEPLVPRQRHEAIRDRGMIVGSLPWAIQQLRHGVGVRRRAWPDQASGVRSLRDLCREIDICPDSDLTSVDWEPLPGFVPYPRDVA